MQCQHICASLMCSRDPLSHATGKTFFTGFLGAAKWLRVPWHMLNANNMLNQTHHFHIRKPILSELINASVRLPVGAAAGVNLAAEMTHEIIKCQLASCSGVFWSFSLFASSWWRSIWNHVRRVLHQFAVDSALGTTAPICAMPLTNYLRISDFRSKQKEFTVSTPEAHQWVQYAVQRDCRGMFSVFPWIFEVVSGESSQTILQTINSWLIKRGRPLNQTSSVVFTHSG